MVNFDEEKMQYSFVLLFQTSIFYANTNDEKKNIYFSTYYNLLINLKFLEDF